MDDVSLDFFRLDLSLIQQEVDALEELSRQLFLETVDLQATKVTRVDTITHTQTQTPITTFLQAQVETSL